MILTNVGLTPVPAWCIFTYDPEKKEFRFIIRRDATEKGKRKIWLVDRVRETVGIPAEIPCSLEYGKNFGFGETMVRMAENARSITYAAPVPMIFISKGQCKKCRGKGEMRDSGMCFKCAGTGVVHDLDWNSANLLVASLAFLFVDQYENVQEVSELAPNFSQPLSVLFGIEPGHMCMNGEFSADFVNWIGLELNNDSSAQHRISRSMHDLYMHMMTGGLPELAKMNEQRETKIRTEITGRLSMRIPGSGTILVSLGERMHCGEGWGFNDHNSDHVHQLLTFLAGLGLLQKEYFAWRSIDTL